MKKKGLILLVSMLAAGLLLFSLVYADSPDRPRKGLSDDLELTEAQMKEMREIEYDFTKTGIGLRADLREVRLELQHQLAQQNVDKKEIEKLVDRVAQAHKLVLKHQIDRKLAIKAVLTPEQFEKFLQRRGGKAMERMGRGGKFRRHESSGLGRRGDGPGI
jgi:Spy/CpxP family protein refolding chaperone